LEFASHLEYVSHETIRKIADYVLVCLGTGLSLQTVADISGCEITFGLDKVEYDVRCRKPGESAEEKCGPHA
jgi:hypothetical protein